MPFYCYDECAGSWNLYGSFISVKDKVRFSSSSSSSDGADSNRVTV